MLPEPAFSSSTPAASTNLRSMIKEECLGRMIMFGERHLRDTIAEFVGHYSAVRDLRVDHSDVVTNFL